MPRFVILEHDYPQQHWDLMLEAGPVLRTWRLAEPPDVGRPVAATASFDHRPVYLDYEGPVSGNRGTVQRFFVDGREMLYLMTFCLPRFLDQSFDEKLITVFHELYHISPTFDGDLRRHEGRYAIHSHSQRCYDQHMAHLARAYLAGRPDPSLHAFLRLNFGQLQHRHGKVEAVVVPRPKLLPVVMPEPLPAAASE